MSEFSKEFKVTFSVDMSGLKKSLADVQKNIDKALGKADAEMADTSDTMTKEMKKAANNVEKSTSKMEKSFAEMSGDFKKQASKISGEANKSSSKVVTEFKGISGKVKSAFSKIGGAFNKSGSSIKGDASKAGNAIKNELKNGANGAEASFEALGNKAKTVFGAIAGYVSISSLNSMIEESKEYLTQSSKLETAFKSAGGSAKTAQKTYDGLYSVLGDSDRATEATQLLSHMTTNQKELSGWTEILTGVYGQYGDALPVESLAESANETAKVGQVTGTLADALNWAGVSEDKFNAKLEKCSSEQERQQLIQKTLSGLYSESADIYRENNAEVIALNEAQNKQAKAMANVSKHLMPIKTALTELGTKVLNKVADGLAKLQEMLPTIVEFFKEHKTEIIAVSAALTILAGGFIAQTKGATLVTKAMTGLKGIMTGLGTAFSFLTSPVGLITVGIALLVAGIIIAYKKCDTFRNFVNKMKDGLVESFNKIKEVAIIVKDKFVGAWNELIKQTEHIVTAIKKNLSGAFGEVKDAANGVKEAFGELKEKFQPVVDIISGAFSKCIGEVSDKFDTLKSKVIGLSETALKKLNDNITKVREGFGKLRDFASDLWDKLDPLVTLIRDNLVKSLKSMADPISEVKKSMSTLWDTLKKLGSYLWDELKPIFDLLKPLLKAIGGLFGGALVVGIGLFMSMISGLVKAIKGIVKVISGVIKTVVNVFKLIVGMFTGNADMISEAWEGIKDGIIDVIKGIGQAIKGFLTGFWDGLSGFFKGLFSTELGKKLKEKVAEIWDSIKEAWLEQWNKTKDRWNELKTFVVGIWDNLKTKTSEIWNTIKENTIGKAMEMRTKMLEKFNSMKDGIVEKISTMKNKIKSKFDDLKKLAGDTVSGMKDKVTKGAKGFANAFIKMINKAVSGFLKGINKIISGINWVYKTITGNDDDKFSKIQVSKHKIPLLAKGTNNWQGGMAIVGERGRELVNDPNMGTFIANRATLLPLSKHATVIPNRKTESMLRGMGIPAFEDGYNDQKYNGKAGMDAKELIGQTGEGAEALNLLKQAWNKHVSFDNLPNWLKDLVSGVKKIFTGGAILDWVKKLMKDNEDKTVASWTGDNGGKWAIAKGWAEQALSIMGYVKGSAGWNAFMEAYRIVGARESNYNNAAWNKWDINAKRGTPSRGWLQFIEPTFNSYKKKGYNNWLDPVHQAIAFINYANKRYGGAYGVPGVKSIRSGGRYLPYANGGLITSPTMALMGEAGTEAVVPLNNDKALKPFGKAVANSIADMNNNGGLGGSNTVQEIHTHVYLDSREIGVAVTPVVKEEMNRLDKQNSRLKGKR